MREKTKTEKLGTLVERHVHFWRALQNLRREPPGEFDLRLQSFMETIWDPFFLQFTSLSLVPRTSDVEGLFVENTLQAIGKIRQAAQDQYLLPLPPLATGTHTPQLGAEPLAARGTYCHNDRRSPMTNERGHYGRHVVLSAGPRCCDDRGRGYYARHAYVGGILFHTVGDRDALVEQVNTGFTTLVNELISKMGGNPRDLVPDMAAMARDPVGYTKRTKASLATIQKSPLYPFWRDVVTPEYNAWNKFWAEQSSWEEWKTDYSTYENWVARLESMRDTVNKKLSEQNVAPLEGPRVVSLPKTVMEKGGEAVEKAAKGVAGLFGDTWSIVKWGAIGALVIGGVVVVSSAASKLKKGHDPAAPYEEMIRTRRERARSSLPPPRLALPAGEPA